MNKICTSLEQSRELIKLGIDLTTADMFWHRKLDGTYDLRINDIMLRLDISAWSLAALLNILSCPDLTQTSDGGWFIRTWYKNCPYSIGGCENPVDACVEMIIKLNELKIL